MREIMGVLTAGLLVSAAVWMLLARPQEHRLKILLRSQADKPAAHAGSTLIRRWFPTLFDRTPQHQSAQDQAVALVDRAVQLLRVGVLPARVMRLLSEIPGDAELAAALGRMARVIELGEPPHVAIDKHLGALPESEREVLAGMSAVWFVAESAGAPAADMLARYAQTCREKADSERERDVALAGPQSTVTVLTWLPLLSIALAVIIGADFAALLTSPAGFASLTGGVALLFAGRLWMRVMLKKAL